MAKPLTTAEVLERFITKHSNLYDYTQVEYTNMNTKVIIICHIHGPFHQQPRAHLSGQGCPKCTQHKNWKPQLTSTQYFDAVKKLHGRYTYDENSYISTLKPIRICCQHHGWFQQRASSHLNGRGCPKCAKNQLKTTDEFIIQARLIHGTKYDYSRTKYTTALRKVPIICHIHGEFKQKPVQHLNGRGCPKCGTQSMRIKLSNNQSEFISRLSLKHNNKYDYSKVIYNSRSTIIDIICPIHGTFKQRASEHLRGYGCPHCAGNQLKTTQEYVVQAQKRWNNKYSYTKTSYINNNSKIIVACPKHGDFQITAKYHLHGGGCPTCALSTDQYDLTEFVKTMTQDVLINNRTIIYPYELDIVIPKHKLAIEYNGNYYHSYNRQETTEERRRHQTKANLANDAGYQLIQIGTHEWKNKQEIVKSMIKHKFMLSNRVYARNCEVSQIKNLAAQDLFSQSHISGHRAANVSYGLYLHNNLISAINFTEIKPGEWEIIRYANIIGTTVVGGLTKLLSRFIIDQKPSKIMTFVDRRYGNGNGYMAAGFKLISITNPGYVYLDSNCNLAGSRIKFQKHKLTQFLPKFDANLSESQNMFNHGYRRLWDAGHMKLIKICD